MGVFLYSPGVRVMVDTAKTGTLDLSDDIASGTLTLRENAPHSFQCVVLNVDRKYDQIFTPNDRIAVYLKRVRWLLCFTGYLNTVPYFTAFPQSINLDATCTLKRLQYRFWDPGTDASYHLMFGTDNSGTGPDGQVMMDGGLKTKAINLLTQVCGWQPDRIHIGAVPNDWVSKVHGVFEALQPIIAPVVGASASIGGSDPLADGAAVAPASEGGTAPGCQLPATSGVCSFFGGTDDTANSGRHAVLTGEVFPYGHPDPWYCEMRFGYRLPDNSGPPPGMSPSEVQTAMGFWTNHLLMVVNTKNNKACIVRCIDWGPPQKTTGVTIGLSPHVGQTLGVQPDDVVSIAFAPPGASPGIYTSPSAAKTGVAGSTNYPVAKGGSPVAMQWPCSAVVTQEFGAGGGAGHPGIDIGVNPGTVVYACAGGTVTNVATGVAENTYGSSAGALGGFGNAVMVDMGGGFVAIYGHLRTVDVAVGATVTIGTQLGLSNNTGDSSGPHLHFQINVNGKPTDPRNFIDGNPDGTPPAIKNGTATAGGGTADTSFQGLINAWQWYGSGPNPTSDVLTGARALMNDAPIMPTIDTIMQASMRSYCAAPNGDFIGWFPDYFGIYGTAAKLNVETIELQDFTMVWSDNNLITHQFVAGSAIGYSGDNAQPGGSVDTYRMFMTEGIVSVEFPQVMDALFNIGEGGNSPFGNALDILNRYGARPNFTPMPMLSDPEAEFWYAMALFQRNWAQQFTAQVPLTFMPEAFPGMLLCLPAYGFQAYINQVVHTFSTGAGGQFTSDVYISAPARTGGTGPQLWGLQPAGVGA